MESQEKCKPVKLFYQLYEPIRFVPELSPIIFLHGLLGTHATWRGIYTKIGDKTSRKVYIVDLRNYGKSEYSELNSLHDQNADLENFLSENKIQKCIFIGHSIGGRIAMFFAMTKPELVEKLIIEETQLSNVEVDIKDVKVVAESGRKMYMLPKGLKEAEVRDILSRIVTERYPFHYDLAVCAPLSKKSDGTYQFDFNFDVIEKSMENKSAFYIDFKECRKFEGPVLVLHATKSAMKVETDKKIKEYFPNAEFSGIDTHAHIIHIDRPKEFVTNASNFINK